MLKKILIGGLIAILVGAVAVGIFDYLQGDSALAYRGDHDTAAVDSSGGNGQGRGSSGNSGNTANTASRGAGQSESQGTGVPQVQASVDEWLTVSGEVLSIDANSLMLETADGREMEIDLGPEQFWMGQDIAIEPGDTVEVLGFYEDEAFVAGDIQLATGEHLMLRDPNGRPLWSGGMAAGSAGQATSDQRGQGRADGSQDPQPQAVVDEWVTFEGTVTAVELNALTVETAEGETMLVQLGPEHFWTTQGVVFEAGDQVSITGFYEDEVSFSAGSVTLLATGETLTLRDADGRPLWAGGSGGSERGGGGYRGGKAATR